MDGPQILGLLYGQMLLETSDLINKSLENIKKKRFNCKYIKKVDISNINIKNNYGINWNNIIRIINEHQTFMKYCDITKLSNDEIMEFHIIKKIAEYFQMKKLNKYSVMILEKVNLNKKNILVYIHHRFWSKQVQGDITTTEYNNYYVGVIDGKIYNKFVNFVGNGNLVGDKYKKYKFREWKCDVEIHNKYQDSDDTDIHLSTYTLGKNKTLIIEMYKNPSPKLIKFKLSPRKCGGWMRYRYYDIPVLSNCADYLYPDYKTNIVYDDKKFVEWLNNASVNKLIEADGIGKKIAESLYKNKPYRWKSDIRKIKGISKITIKHKLKTHFRYCVLSEILEK